MDDSHLEIVRHIYLLQLEKVYSIRSQRWPVLIRPLVAGFNRPLTLGSDNLQKFLRNIPQDIRKSVDVIDGFQLFTSFGIVFNQYVKLLRSEGYRGQLLARFRVTNAWRKVLFMDHSSYLEFVEKYGYPIGQKSHVEVPEFRSGRNIIVDTRMDAYIKPFAFLIEGLGLPAHALAKCIRGLPDYLIRVQGLTRNNAKRD